MSEEKKGFSRKVQAFGSFLSSMIMPNIAAFIAWGLITALFIEAGWLPNEDLAGMGDDLAHLREGHYAFPCQIHTIHMVKTLIFPTFVLFVEGSRVNLI